MNELIAKWIVAVLLIAMTHTLAYLNGRTSMKEEYAIAEATKRAKTRGIEDEANQVAYGSSDAVVNEYLDRVFGKEDRVRACKTMCPDSLPADSRPCDPDNEKVDYIPFDYTKAYGVSPEIPSQPEPVVPWVTESDDTMGEYLEGDVPVWAEPKFAPKKGDKESIPYLKKKHEEWKAKSDAMWLEKIAKELL